MSMIARSGAKKGSSTVKSSEQAVYQSAENGQSAENAKI
jgi:hypothetical protein